MYVCVSTVSIPTDSSTSMRMAWASERFLPKGLWSRSYQMCNEDSQIKTKDFCIVMYIHTYIHTYTHMLVISNLVVLDMNFMGVYIYTLHKFMI